MIETRFDVIVIGGGAAGFVSAKFAHGLGKSVAIVEKERLGGECTWSGCVPSKALIYAADHKIEDPMAYAHATRERVYNTHTPESFEDLGIKIFFGSPTFVDARTIQLNDKKLRAKKIIIATGSSPFIPPVPGLSTVPYLTNQNFFDLARLPHSLTIMGGGPIGVELACALVKLGVKVTLVEMQDRIMGREDKELALLLQEKMVQDGVTVLTNAKVVSVGTVPEGILATVENKKGETSDIVSEHLLVATGRAPNIDGLELSCAGVVCDRRGIKTDATLKTNAKHIYACGDVVGPYQFSHMAEYQAIIAARNALLPFSRKVDYTNKIWVTFAGPELASVGLNEEETRKKYGDTIRLYRIEYKTIDRAMTDEVTSGLAKFVCDKKGNLLGAQVLGPRAGEIIHEAQLGRTHGISFAKFDHVIHAYPTYSDVIKKAARLCRVDLIRSNIFVRIARFFLRK